VDQAALAGFVASGAFYGHVRRCRREYAARLDAFLSAAEECRAPLEFRHADSGMNLLGRWTSPPRDLAAVDRRVAALGFALPSLDRYWLERAPRGPAAEARPRGLVFGFSAFAPGAIRAAWRKLAPALRG
jgi:DNA-binding transcriptional MocR family regulator